MEILGECLEGATIKGIADYGAGKQGASKRVWFRESLVDGRLDFLLLKPHNRNFSS